MSSFVIARLDTGLPVFWSLKVGRNFASPIGGWGDKDQATQFARESDAQDVILSLLRNDGQHCKVVPYE